MSTTCSNCELKLPPVMVFDIDGTLCDWHLAFIEFSFDWAGSERENLYIPDHWNGVGEFSDFLQLSKFEYRQMKTAFRQGGFKRWMKPFGYAAAAVQKAKEHGVEVWIATTRPWLSLDSIDRDTMFWLKENEIPYDYMIFGQDKVETLLQRVAPERILAYFDDEDENIRIAQSHGVNSFLVSGNWNIRIANDYCQNGKPVVPGARGMFQKVQELVDGNT